MATLISKISSTAGSPTVNYSATYTATRATSTTANVSVTLSFKGWLNSSASNLGNGIKLTVYARMNGGAWSSAVLKTTSQAWSGTTQHTANNIVLSGSATSNKAKIEFYVTRSGSTYGGSAGNLGSASKPKSYTATLPAYDDGGDDTPTPEPVSTDKYIYFKIGGVWKKSIAYIKNSTWKKSAANIKTGGVWKST